MPLSLSRRNVLARAAGLGALALPSSGIAGPDMSSSEPVAKAMAEALSYARSQHTTGFMAVRDRTILVQRNWPAPDTPLFRAFAYETTPEGALLEDVASQQKSWVSMLVAIAIDKGLIDVNRPVLDYLGKGWSKAETDREAAIRVIHVLNMSSGLTEAFTYEAPPGSMFFYNTPVYAITQKILSAAAGQPLETLTRDWLTAPAGLTQTAWRHRPANPLFTAAGNTMGLVTSPRDSVRFGQIVLDGGLASDGTRLVSQASLGAMFQRSPANPAYGRLWWLNGGAYSIRRGQKEPGPLIPAAPADLVAALGALDRKLYIAPSQKLIVVRMGAATDLDFDQQLWLRLTKALA